MAADPVDGRGDCGGSATGGGGEGGDEYRGNRLGMPVDEADLSAEFASPFVLSNVLSVRQRRK